MYWKSDEQQNANKGARGYTVLNNTKHGNEQQQKIPQAIHHKIQSERITFVGFHPS